MTFLMKCGFCGTVFDAKWKSKKRKYCTKSCARKDTVAKNLHAKGSRMGPSRLTKDKVMQIRAIGRTRTIREIGRDFDVHHSSISDILLRKTWKHI